MYFKRLKELREDKDLRQEDIAKILGIKQQQYYRYENGIQDIPIKHLIKLSKLYNKTTDYILNLQERRK